jgi:hypothetical protein
MPIEVPGAACAPVRKRATVAKLQLANKSANTGGSGSAKLKQVQIRESV